MTACKVKKKLGDCVPPCTGSAVHSTNLRMLSPLLLQDLSINIGVGGQSSSAGASQDIRRVANPYLDNSVPRESRGIRQMQARSLTVPADGGGSLAEERRGHPRPTVGASNKIQVRGDAVGHARCVSFCFQNLPSFPYK